MFWAVKKDVLNVSLNVLNVNQTAGVLFVCFLSSQGGRLVAGSLTDDWREWIHSQQLRGTVWFHPGWRVNPFSSFFSPLLCCSPPCESSGLHLIPLTVISDLSIQLSVILGPHWLHWWLFIKQNKSWKKPLISICYDSAV